MEFTQEGPVSSSSAYQPGPVEPTPQQRLLLMDDVQWESFIERCARQLEKEGQYAQVLKLGGANDKGRDICGYTVHPPASDTWDLYQAKYYSSTLSPSQIVGELAKFLSCVQDGSYTCPRRYYLCAPTNWGDFARLPPESRKHAHLDTGAMGGKKRRIRYVQAESRSGAKVICADISLRNYWPPYSRRTAGDSFEK